MASRAARDFPNLTVLSHPLIQHKLTILRDKQTSTRDFKQLVNEIAMLMAYEVTKDLPLEAVEIETPLEKTTGSQVAGKKLTLVPILRAGLGMVEGISQLIPSARVGHIGLYRNHDTLQPVDYYFKIPSGAETRQRNRIFSAPARCSALTADTAEPPVASMGSSRKNARSASPEGILK